MSNIPVQLVVAAFQDEGSANEALKALKRAHREKLIKIDNAAVLRKDHNGKLKFKETGDWGGGKGAAVGGAIGAAAGMILGPGAILTGAAGALIGGLAAKLRDSGFDDNRLKKLGEGLQPGTSAIVALVEHTWVALVEEQLEEYAMDVMTEEISNDIAEQLKAGKEVTLSALSTDEAASVERIVSAEDEIEIGRIAVDEDSLVAGRAVITGEGVAGERLTLTDDAAVYEAGVVTDEGAAFEGVIASDEGVVGGEVVFLPDEETPQGVEDEEAEKPEESGESDSEAA